MVHAATIFLSSFLLFLVQPLIARLILPWFGGSAAVWTTCMLFFQVLLLGGYAYAHALNAKLRGRGQAIVHTILLAAAVACLPIAPAESWKPAGGEEPITRILLLLGATVGLPYFLLAATSPLLQAWYVRAKPHGNPYRLFAISNLASLAALAGYPFVVEPYFAAHEQVVFWSWLFTGFAALCAALAWLTPPSAVEREFEESGCGETTVPSLAVARGDRIGAAARGNQPPDAERRIGAAAVAGASYALPAELHPHLRRTRLVPAGVAVVAAAALARRHGLAAGRFRLSLRPAGAAGHLPAGTVPGLPVLSRRVVPAASSAAAPDGFLPHDGRGRRAGRPAGRGDRAPRLQRLLRARRRTGGSRAARRRALRRRQSSGAGCEPRRAARRHGLRGLRQLALPARRARLHPQLLRGAPSEGVRLSGRGKLPSPPGARRDHARRAIPVRRAAQADHHLLPAELGNRRRDPVRAGPADPRRRDRPGHRDPRGVRSRG